MRDSKPDFDRLMSQYLAGELTEVEVTKLKKLLSDQPDDQEQLDLLKKVWSTKIAYPLIVNAEEQKHLIWRRLNNKKRLSKKRNEVMSKVLQIFRYAAVLPLFACLGYIFWVNSLKDEQAASTPIETIEHNNPLGQKSKIQLPDGTLVWLNAGSRMTYRSDYNLASREVVLEGEAFFEVMRNAALPLEVLADDLRVTALGTSFNVKAFEAEDKFVALSTGSVKIECTEKVVQCEPHILKPGELASYEKGNNNIHISSFSGLDPFGWKEGRIVFNHASFDEVLTVLSRWYNVKIEIEGKLRKNWDYSSTFNNEILENVLLSLKFSENIDYKLSGNKLIIKI